MRQPIPRGGRGAKWPPQNRAMRQPIPRGGRGAKKRSSDAKNITPRSVPAVGQAARRDDTGVQSPVADAGHMSKPKSCSRSVKNRSVKKWALLHARSRARGSRGQHRGAKPGRRHWAHIEAEILQPLSEKMGIAARSQSGRRLAETTPGRKARSPTGAHIEAEILQPLIKRRGGGAGSGCSRRGGAGRGAGTRRGGGGGRRGNRRRCPAMRRRRGTGRGRQGRRARRRIRSAGTADPQQGFACSATAPPTA